MEGGLYQYSVVLGKKAMSHSNTKGVDMGVHIKTTLSEHSDHIFAT